MSVPGVARVAPSLDTVLRLSFARRVAPALLATRTIATTCERRPAPSASPVTCSICLPHILSTHGSGSQHRSIHRSVRVLKSKRSFAASVDEDLSRAVDEDVQVMRTKGKGAKAAKASLKSSKTKRGNKEAQEKDDGDRYATSTRNSELPGETFDSDKLTENMLRTVERCRSTISHKVGMIGRVDPSSCPSPWDRICPEKAAALPFPP
ncbi:hypothetical protein K437DRAFT_57361 [Tilletiaria anomala UBC 951]|uniref:Uncharacterized protein n=1 Tax=Tilletiaria anomala (strain ATCC 24038 / CBS 436.72 / UBC 951) TaxID=1037660 RepID=A0A066V3K8_TILAU|nr:uncharacterized protein K437DRAFT_57361 [Tilletiaria anomala UBC 951]KDN36297.1 hypothetical protein K437DRAFT_57361 [Tilletiaria anomala UBC 951]